MIKNSFIFTLLLLLLCLSNLQAKQSALTNRVVYSWSNLDRSCGWATNAPPVVTNYFKYIVFVSPGVSLNAEPGQTIHIPFTILNVGSIDETAGIRLSSFFNTNIGSISITSNSNNMASFKTNISSLTSGGFEYYWVNITIPLNKPEGLYSFMVTNKGLTAAYPLTVVYSNVLNVRFQNITICSASDGIHTIKTFDGRGLLGNLDVTIDIKFQSNPSSVSFYYDIDGVPDGSAPNGTININRKIVMTKVNDIWRAKIPALDPEIKDGKQVNFIVEADGQKFYYSGTVPYSYFVRYFAAQEDGDKRVTILNNVGDLSSTCARVVFALFRASFVNITVFNLRGEVIKVLKNGSMPIGRFFESWCGRNMNDQDVSAGLYFLVVTTSEYKVMKKILYVKK